MICAAKEGWSPLSFRWLCVVWFFLAVIGNGCFFTSFKTKIVRHDCCAHSILFMRRQICTLPASHTECDQGMSAYWSASSMLTSRDTIVCSLITCRGFTVLVPRTDWLYWDKNYIQMSLFIRVKKTQCLKNVTGCDKALKSHPKSSVVFHVGCLCNVLQASYFETISFTVLVLERITKYFHIPHTDIWTGT